MAEIKNIENATINNGAEGNPNPNPDQKNDQAVKQPGKIKKFFEKHGGKVKAGLFVVGGVAAGIAADKLGLKLGSKKKGDDQPGGDTAE